ncbi:MAG: M56 family metallopeptidase [Phycisphaerales bacterium]
MASADMYLHPFLDWLIRATWQASILVGLILLVQKVAGRWLGVRGRYCLWLVLIIRLAIPWAPQSGVSLYNLLPFSLLDGYETHISREAGSLSAATEGTLASGASSRAGSAADGTANAEPASEHRSQGRRLEVGTATFLLLFWLAGVCVLGGYVVLNKVRLCRMIRRGRLVTDRWILAVFQECRNLIGMQVPVEVTATDEVGCPALCGCIRPRLLLPKETLAARDRDELRHIFLHELAHLKRRDLLLGHVMSLLHILHWFNPLIALGLRQMRADCELACDALALSVLHPDERVAYGQTLVRQIERLLASRWCPVLPALCGEKARIKQRIAMISRFRREHYRWSLLAIGLVMCLACVGLTDALPGRTVPPPSNPWDAYARGNFRTTHQDKHANIQRGCFINRETGKYLVVDGETVACADEPGEAGLWEFRYDEDFGKETDIVFFYSVATGKYLTCDSEGNLAVNCPDPNEAARWNGIAEPRGVWIRPDMFKDRHLFVNDEGRVAGYHWNSVGRSWWDTHRVWRVKTSNNPLSNPEWQREHIPGPD